MDKKQKKDIRDFLLVIFAGVACAFMALFWMIKEDPYEKELTIAETLLSPSTIETLSNRAVGSNPAFSAEYLIESIDFSHFDTIKSKWEMIPVDIAPYKEIYQLIEGDVGSTKADETLIREFETKNLSTLAIYVTTHEPYQTGAQNSLFQQVQFIPESDWYRVQIHSENKTPEWVYYKHPEALKKILSYLKGQS